MLEAALADARALLEDGTQEDVNAAVAAIDAAVKGLVTDSQKPGGPETQRPPHAQGPDEGRPNAGVIPSTGDNSLPVAGIAAVAAVIIAAAVVFHIGSRKN